MLTDWEKFKGWSVLEFFLERPTTEIHVKELARVLRISPLTANLYLNAYWKDGVLGRAKKGNALFYRLIENAFTQSLKKCFVLSELARVRFVQAVLEENLSTTGIVLYGTRASGEYDEKSDYDMMVFSKDKTFPKKAALLLKPGVTLRVLSLLEWRRMNPAFKESVRQNHVVVYGSDLVKV